MKYFFSTYLPITNSQRIDIFLANLFIDMSRSYIQKLVDEGFIKVNWQVIDKNLKVKNRDIIDLILKEQQTKIEAENLPLDIIFENKDFVVINKDSGVNTHPVPWEAGNSGTLVNALLYHIKNLGTINWVYRPWIVHRLDKNTSWLLVIAKNDKSMKALAKLIENRKIKKTYLAFVCWIIKEDWYIESYIWRDPNNRQKMTIKDPINPKLAKSQFKILKYFKNKYTLIEVDLLTWRTHQIRVHLSSIGFPIVWDETYGNLKINKEARELGLERQFLHAYKLDFMLFWENYHFEWNLKSDLENFLEKIEELSDSKTMKLIKNSRNWDLKNSIPLDDFIKKHSL